MNESAVFSPQAFDATENPMPSLDELRSWLKNIARDSRVREEEERSTAKTVKPISSNPNRAIWGNPSHERYFNLNIDGTATYSMRACETITAVVRDIILEHKGQHHAPTYHEIAATIDALRSANPDVGDFDLLEAGAKINIPVDLVPACRKS